MGLFSRLFGQSKNPLHPSLSPEAPRLQESEILAMARKRNLVPSQVHKIKSLLGEAMAWGEMNSHPLPEKYPQYEELRALGEELNASFGINGMLVAGYWLSEGQPGAGLGSWLDLFWDGIGDWIW